MAETKTDIGRKEAEETTKVAIEAASQLSAAATNAAVKARESFDKILLENTRQKKECKEENARSKREAEAAKKKTEDAIKILQKPVRLRW